jgi:FkbM family methyltransferase
MTTSVRAPDRHAMTEHPAASPPADERFSRTELLKRMVQRVVHRFGYQLTRFPAPESYDAQIGRFLRGVGVNCILDVGAHEGEYYMQVREAGYRGRIVSFEPVPASFQRLQVIAGRDPLWRGYNIALGNESGLLEINVPDSTGFASFLRPNDFLQQRFPYARWDGRGIEVPVERLSHILDEVTAGIDRPRIFLKMDTQGWDAAVAEGLGERLHDVIALQSEVSVLPLYHGMQSISDSLARYRALGYQLVNLFPVVYDTDDVSVIEFDCLMRRRALDS